MARSVKTPVTVLAAAQSAGGANALIPIVRELLGREGVAVPVLACGEAAAKFAEAQMPFRYVVHETICGLEVLTGREQPAPNALLLATAWGPSLDKTLLRAANSSMVPSVSVIDMWSYYKERYLDPDSGELVLPTRIAVMDQTAVDQAVESGLPEDLLAVTGQPHLEELGKPPRTTDFHNQVRELRESWLDGETHAARTKVVLFASEAIAKYFGPNSDYHRGYTEEDALLGVQGAARLASEATGFRVKVVMRLHPEQRTEDFIGLIEQEPMANCYSGQANVLASDLVVGMTSMFLIEASMAGKATVSFQPGTGRLLPFIGVINGMVESASTVDDLSNLMVRTFNGDDLKSTGAAMMSSHKGAAARIADLTLGLARKYQATKSGETF